MNTINKKLAISPLEFKGVTAERRGGLAMVSQRVSTTSSILLYDADVGDGFYTKGSVIVFRGEAVARAWNKEVIKDEHGVEFVLAPLEEVLMVGEPKND